MEGLPPIRLPIGKIITILLILGLGIGGMTVVAIAPQLLPQFQSYWAVTHYSLELTLGNLGHFDHRISLATWYISSILLLAAMSCVSLATLLSGKRRIDWGRMGIVLILFSADKATGLHHALIHDFLYRLPFALNLKKGVLLFFLMGILGLLIALIKPIWGELLKKAKRLLSVSVLCFFCSEIGVDGLVHSFAFPTRFASSLFPFLEQCFDQLGGIFLALGLLLHIQKELGSQKM